MPERKHFFAGGLPLGAGAQIHKYEGHKCTEMYFNTKYMSHGADIDLDQNKHRGIFC